MHSSGLVVLELTRIIVPKACRKDVLEKFHASHCGINKLKALAKQRFYWPNLNNSLDQLVKKCEKCRPLLPSQVLANMVLMILASLAVGMYFSHKMGSQNDCIVLQSLCMYHMLMFIFEHFHMLILLVCKYFFNTCNHRFKKWLLKVLSHHKDTSIRYKSVSVPF